MKLRNKLLPIIGIAASAAVVAPLVTSCGTKTDLVDLTKGYVPTTKSSVSGEKTQQEATQLYINDVKTNAEIFRQDFLYGVYNKVIKTKNQFLNLPSLEQSITTANFKLNSLKASVTTPTFGSTEIAYPGEPKVTYPTVSFEYTVQIDYKYEYLGAMDETASINYPGDYTGENNGYHVRNVTLETNVKYTNVPFLAIAHQDSTGKNTYWQVSPIDTITINAEEDDEEVVHYYNQAYMFQYMSDDWAIDSNTSTKITEQYVGSTGDNFERTSTPSYTSNISSWDDLQRLVQSSKIGKYEDFDYVNYYDMMANLVNFGFESYYLSSVAQKPEIQATGEAQGYGYLNGEKANTASFGAFYLPQTFDGAINIFAGYNADGKTPEGKIVLTNRETATPITYTIGDDTKGAALTRDTSEATKSQWGVDDQPWTTTASSVAAGTYHFYLPKTIVAQFVPTTGDSWTQVVYINQNTLPIALDSAE